MGRFYICNLPALPSLRNLPQHLLAIDKVEPSAVDPGPLRPRDAPACCRDTPGYRALCPAPPLLSRDPQVAFRQSPAEKDLPHVNLSKHRPAESVSVTATPLSHRFSLTSPHIPGPRYLCAVRWADGGLQASEPLCVLLPSPRLPPPLLGRLLPSLTSDGRAALCTPRSLHTPLSHPSHDSCLHVCPTTCPVGS